MALQSLRDGRARVCVATDVAARGIDLPNLGLVIHADLPNDPEVMQHRSGRTGRAGRKGVSVLLVPPARKRRAEMLLNLAGIEAVWGTAPQPDEIRKLDQERMLKDALFAEETTAEDLALAQALLAERSPEDIAAALARLYRARLPSPEDILDPGAGQRPLPRRSRPRQGRPARRAATIATPRRDRSRANHRRATAWAKAACGFAPPSARKKNAEARWLLPMICRRGGIDKHGHRRHPHHGHHHRVRDFRRVPRNPLPQDPGVPTRKTTSASRRWTRRRRPGGRGKAADAPRREARRSERGALSNDRSAARDSGEKPHGKPQRKSTAKPRI